MSIKNNTTSLQDLLDIINNLPESYTDTADATASAEDIMSGETAYVDGEKVTGTFSIDNELSAQDNLITELQNVIDNLPEAGGSSNTSNTVSITIDGVLAYGFDANGNPIETRSGTHDFLEGIVFISSVNHTILGNQTPAVLGQWLYKFSADGAIITNSSGGGSAE